MTRRARLRRSLGLFLSGTVIAAGLVVAEAPAALASYPVPPTPSGLTSAIEPIQPYIGQSTCQPWAKPGVVAFENLVLRTYRDTGSLGIVSDCGSGGQSEHHEGRAWDWQVNYYNSRQRAEAATLLNWLTKTDQYGNRAANARRLGIMYMIWDHRMWRAYDSRGWQKYDGPNPHTSHVHFSFGWAGARKATSYWTRRVAPLDFGPTPPAHVTPVRKVSNIALVRQYGGTTLANPSWGTAVKLVQAALRLPVDGYYGPDTAAAVTRFQVDQHLYPYEVFGRAEWKALFPPPVTPFGGVDPSRSALGNLLVTGWAIDADTTGPISVSATLDGVSVGTTTAAVPRSDVDRSFPEWGADHGFFFSIPLPAGDTGTHQLCLTALNAPGTPGVNAALGCRSVALLHNPVGALESARPTLGVVRVSGWALDPDVVDPVTTSLTVDGVASAVLPTAVTRTDIAAAWPGIGDNHGVTADLVLSEGSHTVCLSAANVAGTLGTGPQLLGCRTVVVPHSPVGALSVVRRAPGGVLVSGWALDPDVVDAVTADVLADGAVVTTLTASTPVSTLPAAWADNGTAHGFSTLLDLPVGTHSVCVRLHDVPGTPGSTTSLPCLSVTVSHDAAGALTALRNVPASGAVRLAGDAYDPDTVAATAVVPVVDGVRGAPLTAGLTSATAATRWPGYGSAHGFSSTLTLAPGTHRVCVTAVDAAGTPGADVSLGCRTLVVSNTTGAVRASAVYPRRAVVRGWALDPDRTNAPYVAVVVDGRTAYLGQANRGTSALWGSYVGYGSYHGFAVTVGVTKGTHTVCVVARNLAGTPGASRTLGCSRLGFA